MSHLFWDPWQMYSESRSPGATVFGPALFTISARAVIYKVVRLVFRGGVSGRTGTENGLTDGVLFSRNSVVQPNQAVNRLRDQWGHIHDSNVLYRHPYATINPKRRRQ